MGNKSISRDDHPLNKHNSAKHFFALTIALSFLTANFLSAQTIVSSQIPVPKAPSVDAKGEQAVSEKELDSSYYYADQYCKTRGVLNEGCITAAYAAAPSGGIIYLRPGTWSITPNMIVLGKPITLMCANRVSTTLRGNAAAGDIVTIDPGVGRISGIAISNCGFGTSIPKTSGAAIHITETRGGGLYRVSLDDNFIFDASSRIYDGIVVDTCYQCNLSRNEVNGASHAGLWLRGLNASHQVIETHTYANIVSGGERTSASWFIGSWVGGLYSVGDVMQSPSGTGTAHLQIVDDAGLGTSSEPQHLVFDQFIADNSGTRNLNIDAGREIFFSNSWFTSAETYEGIRINGGSDIRFSQAEVFSNATHGIWINGGNDIWITSGSIIAGNSARSRGAYDGLYVSSGKSRFHISDTAFTRQGIGASQKYSIEVGAGAGDSYSIQDNDLSGYVTGALSNGATGVNKQVYGNLPTGPGHANPK
jgi:hypothetical protein